ncbi:MAG: diacylglycerol kinase family lipid kinase [Clostridia bacterium]|nr:diacylglycerol kinase family lipid kinase [Clostridia bacterium]
MGKIFLVGNPCSGKKKLKNNLLDIVTILSRAGHEVTVYPTRDRGDATEVIKKLSDEYSVVVCVGGDGTLNEVITGMMHNKNKYYLAYIPAGTLNEWSSSLHISRNMLTAAEDIPKGKVITLDIGKFGDEFFTYTASFGAFTDVSYSTSQKVKNVLGHSAYILNGARSLSKIRSYHMTLEHDGETVEGDFLFGAVTNSMSVGGIIKLDESQVELNDGLFEVLLIRKPAKGGRLRHIMKGIVNRDFSNPAFEFFKTSKLVIHTEKCLDWTLDGEHAVVEGDTIEISNLNSAISFFVPSDK